MNSKQARFLGLSTVLTLSLLWLFFYRDLYFASDLLLPRDNAKHHLPLFLYIGRYLSLFHEFPEWLFAPYGGAWLAPQANNFLLIAPYRWPGYLLMWLGVDGNIAYKVSLLLGIALFVVGLFFLLKAILKEWWLSLYLCALACITSLVLCFLFQEQALGTLVLLPYFGLAILHAQTHPRALILASSLLGLIFNLHYPHLIIIFLLLVVISALISHFRHVTSFVQQLWLCYRNEWKSTLVLSLFAFLISASPVLFSYLSYADRMESPLRAQGGTIEAHTFADYDRINRYVPSSLNPKNLAVYLNYNEAERTDITVIDDTVLQMTPAIFLILFSLLCVRHKRNTFLVIAISLVSLAAVGIHGPLPYLFFHFIPGIRLFRQWFHFTSLLNLLLLIASGFVLSDVLKDRLNAKHLTLIALMGLALTFTGILSLPWSGLPMLCLALIAQTFKRPHWTAIAMSSWLFLGALNSGTLMMKEYRSEALKRDFTYYFDTTSFSTPFSLLSNTYWEPVIRVKGYQQLPNTAPHFPVLQGIDRAGTLIPLTGRQLSFHKGRIQVALSPSLRGAYFNQIDDGGWIFSDGENRIAQQNPGVLIPATSPTIFISRKATLWRWLVVLMCLPAALYLLSATLSRSRNFVNRTRFQYPVLGFLGLPRKDSTLDANFENNRTISVPNN